MTMKARLNLADAPVSESAPESAHSDTGTTLLADYFSEQQLAEELRKSVKTLRKWRAVHEGPPWTPIGRDPYYHIDDVRKWLRGQRVEA